MQGRIWANYPDQGGLFWWFGNHFVPGTQDEQDNIGKLSRSAEGSFVNDPGWSKGYVPSARIKLDSGIELLASNNGTHREGLVWIEMRNPEQQPTKIFEAEQGGKFVSRSEYRQLFYPSK